MSKIKQMREQQQQLVAEARDKLDEIEKDGVDEARAKELETQYDAAMAAHDKLEEKIAREQRLEDAETRAAEQAAAAAGKRPQGDITPDDNRPRTDEERAAHEEKRKAVFRDFVRFGAEGVAPEDRSVLMGLKSNQEHEVRAQSTATSAGGYLIPEGFQPEIVKSMQAWGPMLDPGVTRVVMTDTGNDLPWPTLDDTSNKGALLAENTQIGEQDVTFGQKTLEAFKYTSKLVRVSLELLQDSAFNVEAEVLNPCFGERLGRIGNEHLTTGTGSSQPNGIVTASTAGVTAAGASTIDFDDMIDLQHTVDPAYRMSPNRRFMFNDSTLKVLRKLKDGDSNYIWQPADARTGAPASVLGDPYSVNQDMASIGGSTKPVIYGDFSKYVVRMVRDFQLVRLNERYMDYLQVGFFAFMRLDGDLMDTAAVKHIVMESA